MLYDKMVDCYGLHTVYQPSAVPIAVFDNDSGLVQDCVNYTTLLVELPQPYAKPSQVLSHQGESPHVCTQAFKGSYQSFAKPSRWVTSLALSLQRGVPWEVTKILNMNLDINSVWPSHTIWWHISGSTLAEVNNDTKLLSKPFFTHHHRCSASITKCSRYQLISKISLGIYFYISQGSVS